MFTNYTFRARLQPALLTVLPLGILLLAWSPGESIPAGALWSLVTAAGGTAFMAQIGRDRGRLKQPFLWSQWGGAPTIQRLRFAGNTNRELLLRRRPKLEQILGHVLPTEREEVQDLAKADRQYESAVAYFIEVTRDVKKFPLILEENTNYGFRRNLWGLKPIGLAIAALAFAGAWAILWLDFATGPAETPIYQRLFGSPDAILVLRVLGVLVNTAALGLWLVVVKPGWVKTTAEAYADRLIGAIDSL